MAFRVFQLCVVFTVGLWPGPAAGSTVSTGAPTISKDVLSLNVSDPQDVTVARGQPATLRCAVNSSESEYTVSWLYGGGEVILPNDTRRQVLEDGSLYIRKAAGKKVNSMEGEYSCLVRNKLGAFLSNPAHLRIAMLAKEFSQQPQDDSVKMTQPVVLSCQIQSTPDTLVQWERDNNPLPQSTRYVPLPSGDLLIIMAQESDAGSYRCQVLNEVIKKYRYSEEGRLYVMSAPTSSSPPRFLTVHRDLNMTVQQGMELVLYCVATGWPTPSIRWTNNASAVVGNSSILRLRNLNVSHSGAYTCTAQNTAGRTTQVYHVHVVQRPYFNKTPASQWFPVARMVRLECEASGTPKPAIRWLKNGEPLVDLDGRIKLMPFGLLFSHTFSTDSGLYQCIAENAVGRVWVAAQLTANLTDSRPAPPVNARCTSYDTTSICLQWDASPNVLVTGYSIHSYHAELDQEYITRDTHFLAKSLKPHTNYTFYIRVYSNVASDQSNIITCQTVLMGSRNLQLKAMSQTTLRADWTTLSSDTPCGGVAEYKLQWRRFGHASNNVQHVSENHYVINGLMPSQRYEVRVQTSGNEDDDLSWTEYAMPSRSKATNRSASSEGPDAPLPKLNRTVMAPVQLEAEPVSPTSINLTWRDPRNLTDRLPGGYYMICYTEVKQQVSCDNGIYVKSTTTFHEIKGLMPYTLYEFKVRSHNLDGSYGQFSQAVECRTVESAPSSVTNLMSKLENSTSVCLRWRVPNATNGQLQGYVISYSLVNISLDLWPSVVLPANRTNAQSCWRSSADSVSMHLTPLEPGRKYLVNVRARNKAGLSPASENITVRTAIGPVPTYLPTRPPHHSTDELHHNQKLGIIVGTGIALLCIVSCITCMIFRRRCLKTRALERARLYGPRTTNGQSTANATLTSGPLAVSTGAVPVPCPPYDSGDHRQDEVHELQCLVAADTATSLPDGTHIPPLSHSHLDTKGGVSYPNGHLNGLKCIVNGHIPNGNIHITENPQYEPYDCNGHYTTANTESHQLLDADQNPATNADDSLLFNDSFNTTQLTNLDESLPRPALPPPLSTVLHTVAPVLDPNG